MVKIIVYESSWFANFIIKQLAYSFSVFVLINYVHNNFLEINLCFIFTNKDLHISYIRLNIDLHTIKINFWK
jgi:hypothetical protein